MKKRKTPIGLVLGMVGILGLIFVVNVITHHQPEAPTPPPGAQQPGSENASDLANSVKQNLGSDAKGPAGKGSRLPGGPGGPGGPQRPGGSMLLRTDKPADKTAAPKPKTDFSGQVVGGWYSNESGVPKPGQ
jgi:hypothetical protein